MGSRNRSRRSATAFAAALAVGCLGCAADTAPSPVRSRPEPPPATGTGAQPAAGAPASEPADFGNSSARPTALVGDPTLEPTRTASFEDCTGGLYLGTYDCELDFLGTKMPLTGDVSFALEIDETVTENQCDAEFCPDLVIAEGSGTLFGLAVGWGFEAALEGGLDCGTGVFRASAPDGVYGSAGSSDPADPNALWTVVLPLGVFTGALDGDHTGQAPEAIEGNWDLQVPNSDIRCVGPFTVSLQP